MESAWGFADSDSDRLIRKFFSRYSFHFPSIFQPKRRSKQREREREAICNPYSHRGSATPATEGTSVATKSSALVRTIISMAQLGTARTATTASVSYYIGLAQVVFLLVQLRPIPTKSTNNGL